MTRKNFIMIILILALSAQAVITVTPAQAATITVTSKLDTADPGKCRLRDAITAANTNTATGNCPAGVPGVDTITFNLGHQCTLIPCTIVLTSALPTVTEDLSINGGSTVISGANLFRVFDLGPAFVDISNLHIANGNVVGAGGAINMSSTALTLNNVIFSNNHANDGGAIYEASGLLTVIDSNFSGNVAEFENGGAIDNQVSGLFIHNSVFNNNSAAGAGGAIELNSAADITGSSFSGNSSTGLGGGAIAYSYVKDASLRVGNCIFDNNSSGADGGAILTFGTTDISLTTFSNNKALGASSLGGALYFDGPGPSLIITDTTFISNTSNFDGGAVNIAAQEATATLKNVTISANSAKNNGGGIADSFATVTANLNNVTITHNTADSDNNGVGDGGGIFNDKSALQLQNSIVAGNFDSPDNGSGGTINPDCSGTSLSQGYNLIGINVGCGGFVNGVNGDKVGTGANPINPFLGALANNGGPTLTHALLPGSPAINAGNPLPPGSGGFACASTDQRSVARPQGNACDMGAYEFEFRSFFLPFIFGDSQ